jgi:hypothetical protein
MEQVEKVRRLYLRRADEVERRASELKNEREQDALLDETVAMRILATLPRFNPQ